jgi:hypothetical protein
MFANIKSPTAKPAGLPMVIVLLCAVNDVVENPRSVICAISTLLDSTKPNSTRAFVKTDERKVEG